MLIVREFSLFLSADRALHCEVLNMRTTILKLRAHTQDGQSCFAGQYKLQSPSSKTYA